MCLLAMSTADNLMWCVSMSCDGLCSSLQPWQSMTRIALITKDLQGICRMHVNSHCISWGPSRTAHQTAARVQQEHARTMLAVCSPADWAYSEPSLRGRPAFGLHDAGKLQHS